MESDRLPVDGRFCASQFSGAAKRDATIASIAPEIWHAQRYETPRSVAKFPCRYFRVLLVIGLYLVQFDPSGPVDDDRR